MKHVCSCLLSALLIVVLHTVFSPLAGFAQELVWNPPTANEDLSSLSDLAGYRIYFGVSPDSLNSILADRLTEPRFSLSRIELPAGVYYFSVSAFDNSMNESALSESVRLTIFSESESGGGGQNSDGSSDVDNDPTSNSPPPDGDSSDDGGTSASDGQAGEDQAHGTDSANGSSNDSQLRAVLDFDGDGRSDIARYQKGSLLQYEIVLSGDGRIVNYAYGREDGWPVVADYTGDGLADLAYVSKSEGQLLWSWRDTVTGEEFAHSFGVPGDRILAGCHFDLDQRADFAFLRHNTLRVRSEPSGVEIELALPADLKIRKFYCADIDGDGIFELLTLTRKGIFSGRARKARRRRFYLSAVSLSGEVLFERPVKKARDIFAIDIDGDGDAEPGIAKNRRRIEIFSGEVEKPRRYRTRRYDEFTVGDFGTPTLELGPSLLVKRGKKLLLHGPLANRIERIGDVLSGARLLKSINRGK